MASKLAIVTGTSRGLGYHIAEQLLERDWIVFGFARSSSSLTGGNYYHIPLDLADLEQVKSYFEGEFLKILRSHSCEYAALINNAGILSPVGPLPSVDLADLQKAFNLNSILPIWLMGFCQKLWSKIPLSIVNLSSGAASKPYAGWAAYCSTKAALHMAGQVMVEDQKGNPNLRVFSYAPGVIDTEMQHEVRQSNPEHFPMRERFQKLYQENKLIPPLKPATDIVKLLETPFSKAFNEIRYGENHGN